jgi:predicted DsbA family dithiol-disulfide isomerase
MTPAHDQSTLASPIPITIYSDVICPWCYVGKRRFEAGLHVLGLQNRAAISWRPFELNPDMPSDGMPRAAYRARKFGVERSADLDRQMMATGRESGIEFAFDRMQRTPNTRLAHQLIWQAGETGLAVQNNLVERLFKGYFEEALDIGDAGILNHLASDAGVSKDVIENALTADESVHAVVALEREGAQIGIQGVPYFVLINKYAMSGAQPPEMWQQSLPKILAEMGVT